MPLDHNASAKQLEADATILRSLQLRYCTSIGSKRAVQEIIDHLLGLADWHRDQIPVQDKRRQQAAELAQELAPPKQDPISGSPVRVIRGALKGADGTISREHQDGSVDVDLGAGNSLKSVRPGYDIALAVTTH